MLNDVYKSNCFKFPVVLYLPVLKSNTHEGLVVTGMPREVSCVGKGTAALVHEMDFRKRSNVRFTSRPLLYTKLNCV